MEQTPIVTIDGPSGAGKGTISLMVARELKWHFLDSGAIYRVLAVATLHHGMDPSDEDAIVPLASSLDVNFKSTDAGEPQVILEGEDVTYTIRTENVGAVASKVASLPRVREALLRRQRAFQAFPGLVADGRDMGTVVFPKAEAKLFLTASAEERANRRYKQLQAQGHDVSITRLLSEIKARDERDSSRAVAPLLPADDALVLDSTDLSVEQVFIEAMAYIRQKIQNG